MIWNKYTIRTTTKDADLVSTVLMENDICDIQIENNVQLTDEELNQIYADFARELPPDDGTCLIDFYFEFEDDDSLKARQEEKLKKIREGLKEAEELFGIDPVVISGEIVDSTDWENNWKAYFKPFEIDDMIIKPTWEELPESAEGKTVIEIDPGMAFGTGLHETTRLCIKGLREYIRPGMKTADFGCGSGILSIAALKLGARSAEAVDIDPQAVSVAAENFEVNGLGAAVSDAGIWQGDDYTIFTGNILEDEALKAHFKENRADIILANILAEIIAPLIDDVADYMNDGAYFIASGIICGREDLIKEKILADPRLELTDTARDGDWIRIIARKIS